MDMLRCTILGLLVLQVTGSLVSQSWSEVIVSADKITEIGAVLGSSVKAANLCSAKESCTMICKNEDNYILSNSVYEADYFEKSSGANLKCWTKLANRFTPIELTEDGLFYHADFREDKLHYGKCLKACRRIPGFRLSIARNDESARAWLKHFWKPYKTDDSKQFIIGLRNNDGTLKWHDGTPYSLTIIVKDEMNERFRMMYGKFWDLGKNTPKNCLCQGNPNNLEW